MSVHQPTRNLRWRSSFVRGRTSTRSTNAATLLGAMSSVGLFCHSATSTRKFKIHSACRAMISAPNRRALFNHEVESFAQGACSLPCTYVCLVFALSGSPQLAGPISQQCLSAKGRRTLVIRSAEFYVGSTLCNEIGSCSREQKHVSA